MKVRQFLNRPAKFNKRPRVGINQVQLSYVQDTTYVFNTLSSNKRDFYTTIIELENTDDVGLIEKNIKFYCSCPSFKYEFGYLLGQHNSLVGDSFKDLLSGRLEQNLTLLSQFGRWFSRLFKPRISKFDRPPKKNQIPYICKHCEVCLQVLSRIH